MNDAVHSVINMDGIVEAKSVANVNGKIVLGGAKEINVAGLVDASGLNKGERGGEINITGDKVTIGNTKNKTTLTASGDQGGGTVLVGGDYQGAGKLANAQTTTVNNTTISADATRQGDGGKVVVWSDDTTEFHGDILARGAHGGDGGLVETSGKHFLTVTGASVNASGGLGGHNGSWLLDPGTYTVDGTNVAQYTDALKNNTDVTIATTADPANNDLGDLFINADMFWDKNSSLTLSSAHDLGINAKISNSAGGNLTLRADNAATNSGTVVFGSAGGISLSTGNVDIFYNAMNKNGQTGFNNMQQIDYKGLGYVTMGSGEYNAYMLVNTIDDLAYIANHLSGTTNNVSHYSFALGANLNEGGNNFDFKSIGNLNNPFMGTFNGNGYTINNLNFVNDAGQPIGLFGVADGATLENIQLSGINISAPTIDNVGAVVGQMQHHSTLNNAIVTNSSISGKNNTGGAVGAMIDSTASQIFVGNNTSITGGDTSIPGADTAMNAGGVVGSLTNSTLELSAADATVTGGTNVGGLVGIISDALSSVSNSFSIGAVSGVDKVGGFVGSNSGTITSAYSTGAVTASGANPTAGGFAGDQQGLVTNGYWNTETSNQTEGTGNAANSGIVGLTTANMTNAGTDNEMLAAFNIGNANSPWGVKSANPNDATIDPSTPYLTWCGSMCTFLVDLGPNNPGGGGGNTGGGNSGNGGNGGDGTGGSGDPSNTANPPPVDIRNEIVKDTQQGLYGSTQSKLLENPPEDPMECSQLYPDDQQKIYECELEKPKYAPGSYPPASNVKPRH